MRASDYQFICDIVYRHSRINLGPDKQELVGARLGKRLRATGLASIQDYCELLRGPEAGGELPHLIDVISTNHTGFFREERHFQTLRDVILPDLERRRDRVRREELRVWSAACSTGEEPYSIAIAVDEHVSARGLDWPWRIEATDISSRVLEKARAGIYPAEAVARTGAARTQTYFQVGYGDQEGFLRVRRPLRDRVRFQRLNLLGEEPDFAGFFHVIFCRNVMIYFDRETQEELVRRLKARLAPGGYLLVGHSESLSGIGHGLRMMGPATYQCPLGAVA